MRKASVELRVAFADLDAMRAVYHTNYIRWFDLARTKLFREAGFSMEKWEGGGILLPLVVCHCEYREGAVFDDPLRVTAQIAEVRGKVVTIEYEIENLDNGRVISTGLTKQVFCDENSKAFVLKEKYPELYDRLTEDAASCAEYGKML